MGGIFKKKVSRKEFLKLAGLGFIGVILAKPFLSIFEGKEETDTRNSYGNGPYGGKK